MFDPATNLWREVEVDLRDGSEYARSDDDEAGEGVPMRSKRRVVPPDRLEPKSLAGPSTVNY